MLDREEWNAEVMRFMPSFGAFLQSYEWGMFQEAIGRRVTRLHYTDRDKVCLASMIHITVGFGVGYQYIPKGPLGNMSENDVLPVLRQYSHNCSFVRIEPNTAFTVKPVDDTQPRATILIDLRKGMDQVLQGMKSKTRYNIRLGERKGVEVREMDTVREFDAFWLLMKQTAVRDRIRLHDKGYYQKLLKALSQQGGAHARLFGAYFEGRLLASNMIVDFAGVRTYLHGATSNLHRNHMAQYVLHAWLMREAQVGGLEFFDFWGVAPEVADQERHAWAGISRYKRSFGGMYLEMPGTFDYVLRPVQYEFYRIARRARRLF